jgi:hypothetical protein
MRLSSLKKWYLTLPLFLVLGVGLGAGPVWGEVIPGGAGNQSMTLQPLADSELAEIAGRNAWVPLPVLLKESLSESRNRTLQTLSNISKQASNIRKNITVIILQKSKEVSHSGVPPTQWFTTYYPHFRH